MNFFIDGNKHGDAEYPDFLDSIIGTIPDDQLIEVVAATPQLDPNDLILHFQFRNLPGRLTCRINKVSWREDRDKIAHFTDQISRVARILMGKASVSELMNLDIEITPELKEWASTENQRKYYSPLVNAPRRNPMPLGYDQDFTTW